MRFYRAHYRYFKDASRRFGVPEEVILAILQVETGCGSYTGQSRTFYRLARLAAASAPDNVKANFELSQTKRKQVTVEQVEARAQWLEREFLPHVVASIRVAESLNLHPHELRGSGAGAIGLPQFLPGNIRLFGFDGDRDGQIDLFDPADAVLSVAKYLSRNGWRANAAMSEKDKRAVIWAYNHSDSYIDTVLTMANALHPKLEEETNQIERWFKHMVIEARRRPMLDTSNK